MRIEYHISTGNPFGQFVVFAESEQDRTILNNFMFPKKDMKFWLHGATYDCRSQGPSSFNFGWIKENK